MTIYCIKPDIENFMFFTINDLDVYEKMDDFDIEGFGKPLKFSWVAPAAEFIKSDSGSTVLPDISQWNGSDLILSDSAKTTLDHLLKNNGEYYPLAGSCRGYWLYNPIRRLGNDIVDLEKTTSIYFDDGAWDRLEKLVFKPNVGKDIPAVFTLEIDRGVNLYCSEAFKAEVEKCALTGINIL